MTELKFFVAGIPAGQGSMKCIGSRGGFHQLIASNKEALNDWRELVQARAEHAAQYIGWHALDCAEVRMRFQLERPKGHYRVGRYAHLLRDDAPQYPTSYPDWDKLGRAISDSLTFARVITDDGVIVTGAIAKRYCLPGQTAGVNVVLSAPPVLQMALL